MNYYAIQNAFVALAGSEATLDPDTGRQAIRWQGET